MPPKFTRASTAFPKVVNYAQWESREAFDAMLGNPEAVPHMKEAAEITVSFESHLYEVSLVDAV